MFFFASKCCIKTAQIPQRCCDLIFVQIHFAAGDHDGREPNHEAQDLSDQLMMMI